MSMQINFQQYFINDDKNKEVENFRENYSKVVNEFVKFANKNNYGKEIDFQKGEFEKADLEKTIIKFKEFQDVFLYHIKITTEIFFLDKENISKIIKVDLTNENLFTNYSIVDNKYLMSTLSFFFYIQRMFIVRQNTLLITNNNLIGPLVNVNPLHNIYYKASSQNELDILSIYSQNPFKIYNYPELIQSDDFFENEQSMFKKIKLSKKTLIVQSYLLFVFIKKCNSIDTNIIISEYLNLIKIILKLIKNVNNKIDYDFIKNISISIEYIKQRFNIKIQDDEIFYQIISIVDTSLFELENLDLFTANKQLVDNNCYNKELHENNANNETNYNYYHDGNLSDKTAVEERNNKKIKNQKLHNLGIFENDKSELKYYNFDEDDDELKSNFNKYLKKQDGKITSNLDFDIFAMNKEDINEFNLKIDYLLYKYNNESIFYIEGLKNENEIEDEGEENNQEANEKSPLQKMTNLIKFISKALLSTNNYYHFITNFLSHHINYFKNSVEKYIDNTLVVNWKEINYKYFNLLYKNRQNQEESHVGNKINNNESNENEINLKMLEILRDKTIENSSNIMTILQEIFKLNTTNEDINLKQFEEKFNIIWLNFQQLIDSFCHLNFSLNSLKDKILIKMIFFRSGLQKLIHNTVDICFIYHKYAEKTTNNLVLSLMVFIKELFHNDPFSISLLLKRGVFSIFNYKLKDFSAYYDSDYKYVISYKHFTLIEMTLIENLIESIRSNNFKISFYEFLYPLLSLTIEKQKLVDFSKKNKKNDCNHDRPLFVLNNMKKTSFNKNLQDIVINDQFLIACLFDTLVPINNEEDYKKMNEQKNNKNMGIENCDSNFLKYIPDVNLSIQMYKLIKEIVVCNCMYDYGDLQNEIILFFTKFIQKYLIDDFTKLMKLDEIIQQEQHQVAELTVIMIGALNHLPEDSRMAIQEQLEVKFLQKLLYWLEDDKKSYKYIRHINEAILRKLLIKTNEKNQELNFKTEENDSDRNILDTIEIYTISNNKRTNLNDKLIKISNSEVESNDQFIYVEKRMLESYLYGEFLKNLINDLNFYLSFEENNKNYWDDQLRMLQKINKDEKVECLNPLIISNNLIFEDQNPCLSYFRDVIWKTTITILKSIIFSSPTITPDFVRYFNSNLSYFLMGLKAIIEYYIETLKNNKVMIKGFVKSLFTIEFANLLNANNQADILTNLNAFIVMLDNNVQVLKQEFTKINDSILIFRYYIEIIKSDYSKIFKSRKDEEELGIYEKMEENLKISILQKYYDNYLKLFEQQEKCLTDPNMEKYVIGLRNYLICDIEKFFTQTANVLTFSQEGIKLKSSNLKGNQDNYHNIIQYFYQKPRVFNGIQNIDEGDNDIEDYQNSSKQVVIDYNKNEILKGSSQLKLFNIIFKVDPNPIQDYFVLEKKETIINLIKICITNIKKIMKKNIFNHEITSIDKIQLVDSFIDQLEFLRLLCENHNKMFQFCIVSHDKDFLSDLLNFALKVLLILNSNFENYKLINNYSTKRRDVKEETKHLREEINKKIDLKFELKKIKVYETSNMEVNFINSKKVFEIIFNFLIEIVQGATPKTFEFLFSEEEKMEKDNSYNDDNNAKRIEKDNTKIKIFGKKEEFDNFFKECSKIRMKIFQYCDNPNFLAKLKIPDIPSNSLNKIENYDEYYQMIYLNFFNDFIRFTTQCLEESNNNLEFKFKILENFNENSYLKLLLKVYKKLFDVNLENKSIVKNKEQENLDDNKSVCSEDSLINLQCSTINDEIDILEKLYKSDLIINNFYYLNKIQSCDFFKLFTNLSLFIKYSINLKKLQGEPDLDKKIDLINQRENRSQNYLYLQTYNFLKSIIIRVEICYTDSSFSEEKVKYYIKMIDDSFKKCDNHEAILNELENEVNMTKTSNIREVYFFKAPESFYLKTEDVQKLLLETKIDEHKQRLVDFVEKVNSLNDVIQIRKKIEENKSEKFKFLHNNVDFKSLINYSVMISVMINLILIFYSSFSNINAITFVNPYLRLIYILEIIQIIYLIVCIGSWIYVNIKLAILSNEDSYKVSELTENTSKLKGRIKFGWLISKSIFNKLHDEIEILLLFWNLIFGILAFSYPIFYSIQLLSLIFIVDVMKTVMSSFLENDRYKQFLAMGLMIIMTLFIYTFIMFFFFQENFNDNDLLENTCQYPLMCFFTLLNQSLRTGEGPDFGIKSISTAGYWTEFLVTWTFYFILILIMISIINGIIVDAFQDLRETKNIRDKIILNNCFICDFDSTNLEFNGENFQKHIEDNHLITNYLNYMIHILSIPESELNAVESYVYSRMKISDISFFPIKDYMKN